MLFCDTHIHLLAPKWRGPVSTRIASAQRVGIDLLIQPGVRSGDWVKLLSLARQNPGVYAA
ncbi:MAG: TatD family hydrolase, partial [Geopsychrobacter sp.]|nr:TatD family hydrolase [Geopsychrobacter sp.]